MFVAMKFSIMLVHMIVLTSSELIINFFIVSYFLSTVVFPWKINYSHFCHARLRQVLALLCGRG